PRSQQVTSLPAQRAHFGPPLRVRRRRWVVRRQAPESRPTEFQGLALLSVRKRITHSTRSVLAEPCE
ncbi:hypothetical protein JZU48_02465, partial [bacterium]|nr:hypothetical protein [bacterium]